MALSLLLLILALAARWGLRYAVVISIAAAAFFNYFFLPPVGTFTIADTQNWVALFAFLGTSIIASQLSNRIQTEANQAKAGKREVEILFQLSRELCKLRMLRSCSMRFPTVLKRQLAPLPWRFISSRETSCISRTDAAAGYGGS